MIDFIECRVLDRVQVWLWIVALHGGFPYNCEYLALEGNCGGGAYCEFTILMRDQVK